MELLVSYPKLKRKSHHCHLFFLHPWGEGGRIPCTGGPRRAQEKVNNVVLEVHLSGGGARGLTAAPAPAGGGVGVGGRLRPWC